MNSKLLSLLGLAYKARCISLGHDAALESLKKKKSQLILITADASERLEKEFGRECELNNCNTEIIRIKQTMSDINGALPQKAGVISINESGFARKMKLLAKEEYYGSYKS